MCMHSYLHADIAGGHGICNSSRLQKNFQYGIDRRFNVQIVPRRHGQENMEVGKK